MELRPPGNAGVDFEGPEKRNRGSHFAVQQGVALQLPDALGPLLQPRRPGGRFLPPRTGVSQPRLAGLPRAPVGQRRPERAEAGRPPRSGLEPAAPAPGAARAGLVLLQDPCDVRGRLNNAEGCFSFPKHTVKKKQTQRCLCCRCETERSRHGLLSMPGLQGKERAGAPYNSRGSSLLSHHLRSSTEAMGSGRPKVEADMLLTSCVTIGM
ncbi:uncharacterized protein LOC133084566 [Eubalaena glacialis]|uniref:uncharacterized protein LOC133084566 n=1 Tax=Eubalaena glacialis TaxID=27606 RepID=UPI002A59FF61|nr:uncharacterized protein LOC133084566 [Eubalaena glacialis]